MRGYDVINGDEAPRRQRGERSDNGRAKIRASPANCQQSHSPASGLKQIFPPRGRAPCRLMAVAGANRCRKLCEGKPDRFAHIVGGASPERITANAVADRRVAGSQHPPGIVKARDHLIAQSTR
jgi:hypothetical protein